MNIKTTTTHTVTFSIQAFWNEEGGMGTDSYGKPVQEIWQAIRLLELARIAQPDEDWIIVGELETTTEPAK